MDFIDTLTAKITEAYSEHSGNAIIGPDYLPDKNDVVEVLNLLRKLLFPGYFDENGDDDETATTDRPSMVRGVLAEVESKLQRLICCALNLETEADGDCEDMYCKAGELCQDFLGRLPHLIEILITDVQATFDGDPAASSKHEIIFAYPGIYAISIYRIAHELHRMEVPLLPRMMTEHAHSLTGIDIHPGAAIGGYLCIDHGTGIVIGETTTIGANVKLYQGVTLGALSTRAGQGLRGRKRHPTIEDGVTIYSGASILGGETVIGKDSVIGGNVFVTASVPPNSRVSL